MNKEIKYLWLVVWLLIAFALRFAYLDWGFPYTFHIDEETIITFTQQFVTSFKTQYRLINPSTSWGNIIFITLGLISEVFSFIKNSFSSTQLYMIFTGRLIAASFSFLGLGTIYILANRLYNQRVALLSLAFNAVLVILIRAAHYYTLEIFLFITVGLTLLYGEKIKRNGRIRDYLLAFICMGLALSSKVTTGLVLLPLIYAHYLNSRDRETSFINTRILFGGLAVLTYFLLNPAIFYNYQNQSVQGTTDIFWVARQMFGTVKPSWTLHFEGLPLFWYEISHNFWFGMGPFLELVMLAGIGWALYRRKASDIYLLLWLIPFYLLIGSWRTKYIRYIVPLAPFGLILGAALCDDLYQKISRNWQRNLYWLVMGGGLLSTTIYAVAFTAVYAGPDSRIKAYRWAKENIQPGATLVLERDESLRLPFIKKGVRVIWMDREELYYKLSGEAKIPYLAKRLEAADYLIIGETNKTRYLHIPELNPVEFLYYTLIDSGALGFQKIKDFKVYPHIGSWEINDDRAELSFHFFDHPRVTIYRKAGRNIPIKSVLFQELMAHFPNANL